MARHLVFDAVRRAAQLYALVGLLAMALGPALVHGINGRRPIAVGLAFSLLLAYAIGAYLAFGSYNQRELYHLPVPRRTWWRAQWVLGVVLGPAWIAAMMLIGAGLVPMRTAAAADVTPAGGYDILAVAAACHVAYSGLFFVLVALTGQVRKLPAPAARLLVRAIPPVLTIVIGAGGVWPFVLLAIGILPGAAVDLQGPLGAVLAVCGALAIAAAFHVPLATARGDADRPMARPRLPARRRPAAGGLLGMRILVAREAAIGAAMGAGVIAAFLGFGWLDGGAAGAREAAVALASPFDAMAPPAWRAGEGGLPLIHAGGAIPLVGLNFWWLLLVCSRNGLFPFMRHLRMLPLSSWRIATYVVAFSMLPWAAFLVLLSVLTLTTTGAFPSIDPRQVVLFGGMVALGHSLGVPWGRTATVATILLVGLLAGLLRVLPEPAGVLVTPVALGILSCAMALLLTRAMLRWASTYRRRIVSVEVAPR